MFVRIYQKKKILFLGVGSLILLLGLFGRLMYLMVVKSDRHTLIKRQVCRNIILCKLDLTILDILWVHKDDILDHVEFY